MNRVLCFGGCNFSLFKPQNELVSHSSRVARPSSVEFLVIWYASASLDWPSAVWMSSPKNKTRRQQDWKTEGHHLSSGNLLFFSSVYLFLILTWPFPLFLFVYFAHRKSLDHVIESNRTAGLVEAVNRHVVDTYAHSNGVDDAALIKPDTGGNIASNNLFMSV